MTSNASPAGVAQIHMRATPLRFLLSKGGCPVSDIYQIMRVSQRRKYSIPTEYWPSEAFCQIYIVRQSSQIDRGQAIHLRSLMVCPDVDTCSPSEREVSMSIL